LTTAGAIGALGNKLSIFRLTALSPPNGGADATRFARVPQENRLVAVPLKKIMGNDGNDKGPFLPSIRNEDVRIYASLFQNRPECSFGHFARVVGNRCVTIRWALEPDFVTAGGLAIKLEAARLQLTNYFPIAESASRPIQAATTMV
jgi:hypothetical protein